MPTTTRFWRALEQVPGLATSAIEWRSLLGPEWDAVQTLLRPTDEHAEVVLLDGEPHQVVTHESGRFVAIPLEGGVAKAITRTDVAVVEIHRSRLVAMVRDALDLEIGSPTSSAGELLRGIGRLPVTRATTCDVHLCAHGDPSQLNAAIRRLLVESNAPIVILTLTSVVDQDILQIARLRHGCLLSLSDAIEIDGSGRGARTQYAERTLAEFRRQVEQWEAGEERADRYKFARSGRVWELAFNGRSVLVPHGDASGLAHIQHLVARPHQPIPVEQLEKMVTGNAALDAISCGEDVVDRTALAKMWTKLRDLNDELDRARRDEDDAARDRIQREREELSEQVRLLHGLNDRIRRIGDDAERARSRVAKLITKVIEVLKDELPELAAHLDNAIDRGRVLTYRPDGKIDWCL